jgi:hypothetical protein
MNGEQLLTTKEGRNIEVLVINNLKPSAKCAKTAKTAGQVLGQLSRAFYYEDHFTFVGLYSSSAPTSGICQIVVESMESKRLLRRYKDKWLDWPLA